jgi:hypothetical protein
VFRDRLGAEDLEWERGRAWAFEQALGLVWYYADSNPVMSALGRRTLQRISADCTIAAAGHTHRSRHDPSDDRADRVVDSQTGRRP